MCLAGIFNYLPGMTRWRRCGARAIVASDLVRLAGRILRCVLIMNCTAAHSSDLIYRVVQKVSYKALAFVTTALNIDNFKEIHAAVRFIIIIIIIIIK